MFGDGSWEYYVDDNVFHPIPGATGAADVLTDEYEFTVINGDGLVAPGPGTMVFDVLDDGPAYTGNEIGRTVEEEAMEMDGPDTDGSRRASCGGGAA